MRHAFYLVVDICAAILDMAFSVLLLPFLAFILLAYLLVRLVILPWELHEKYDRWRTSRRYRLKCEAEERALEIHRVHLDWLSQITKHGYRSAPPIGRMQMVEDDDELGPLR